MLFTDLDGTCIHYDLDDWATVVAEADPATGLYAATTKDGAARTQLLHLPPSTSGACAEPAHACRACGAGRGTHHNNAAAPPSTEPHPAAPSSLPAGAQGVISVQTLRLYASLRSLGVRLVVISGARCSTLLSRLPYLPAADAYVCEGGGRVFYPAAASGGQGLPTAAPLIEDLSWRARHAATAGPAGQDGVPPERRAGSLWALYARLQAEAAATGLTLDAVSYTTAFRVKGEEGAVAAALAALPEGLATAVNLGAADVFPATCGKVRGRVVVGWSGWAGWGEPVGPPVHTAARMMPTGPACCAPTDRRARQLI